MSRNRRATEKPEIRNDRRLWLMARCSLHHMLYDSRLPDVGGPTLIATRSGDGALSERYTEDSALAASDDLHRPGANSRGCRPRTGAPSMRHSRHSWRVRPVPASVVACGYLPSHKVASRWRDSSTDPRHLINGVGAQAHELDVVATEDGCSSRSACYGFFTS